MPWARQILSQFQMVLKNPSRAEFSGPYNKLLCTLFPVDTDYTVAPRYVPGPHKSAPLGRFWYEVLFGDNKPVFVLELKRPGDLRYSFKRHEADQQIRQRMKELRRWSSSLIVWHSTNCLNPKDEFPLPVIHAVSAFGTRLCFYRMSHNQPIEPPPGPILAHTKHRGRKSTAPQERWDCDILEEEGAERFKSVVEEIKQACASL